MYYHSGHLLVFLVQCHSYEAQREQVHHCFLYGVHVIVLALKSITSRVLCNFTLLRSKVLRFVTCLLEIDLPA